MRCALNAFTYNGCALLHCIWWVLRRKTAQKVCMVRKAPGTAALTCSSLRLAEEAEAAAAAGAAGEAGSEGCTVSDISDSQPARFSVSCVSRICRHCAHQIRHVL